MRRVQWATEQGPCPGRECVGIVSAIVFVLGVAMLVRHRAALGAMLRGARRGVPVENVAPGRRVVIVWAVAIVAALVATGVAYVHLRGVVEGCVFPTRPRAG
jgi:hypothetical protein